ncbi:MAG: hypothetical protein WDZ50_01830 [Woeseia sp.]
MSIKCKAVIFSTIVVLAGCDLGDQPTRTLANSVAAYDAAADYSALARSADADGNDWFRLAVDAREAGDTATARMALQQAADLEFSVARIALERARLAVVENDPDLAISTLQALADSGFTAVGMVTADPLLSSLAGRERYDALLATLSETAYPCQHPDRFREFDFWIGEWEVRDAGGQLAGTNLIEAAHEGCVLVEQWQSATGGTGTSMNYLDHASGEWVQVWIDSGGGQIDIRGNLTEEGMLLAGHIHYTANGTTLPFRGLWTPLPDGRVRQFFQQSSDNGETWQTWFEGFYSRIER